jgi:hypothetical protein
MILNMEMSQPDAERLAGALGGESGGGMLTPPAGIQAMAFKLTVTQPSLGSMLSSEWTVNQLPAPVVQRRQGASPPPGTLTPPQGAPVGPPTPPRRSRRGAQAAPVVQATPAPQATPALQAAPTTATLTQPLRPEPLPQPAQGPVLLLVASPLDITHFIQTDLADFISPNVVLLTSHLKLPLMEMLLTDQVILR